MVHRKENTKKGRRLIFALVFLFFFPLPFLCPPGRLYYFPVVFEEWETLPTATIPTSCNDAAQYWQHFSKCSSKDFLLL